MISLRTMLTPMMQQYREIKQKNPGCIVFFRLGDFYEMFFEDAEAASKILQITLTSREAGKGRKAPMCGIPHHAADGYIAKLVKHNHRVAICEQVEDPKEAKGIVRREITRIITPGTLVGSSLLDAQSNNFLSSVCRDGMKWGLGVVDLSTGEFLVTEVAGMDKLCQELIKFGPAECVIPASLNDAGETAAEEIKRHTGLLTPVDDLSFDPLRATEVLTQQFGTHSLDGFGCAGMILATGAAGAIVSYLADTQRGALGHLKGLRVYSSGEFMVLDESTRRNLELTRTSMGGEKDMSLLGVLDTTLTPMGARLMRAWLERPLIRLEPIRKRLDSVEELVEYSVDRKQVSSELKKTGDLERIIGRIGCAVANARDLIALSDSLKMVPGLKKAGQVFRTELLSSLFSRMDPLEDVVALIERSIAPDPPAALREGGIIRQGHNEELDGLRTLSKGGRDWIADLEAGEVKKTGIKSLKVGYNKVFGYYIEVTKPNLPHVPPDYIRKQTLVNCERFITPELKEKEVLITGAEEKITELEYRIFQEIRQAVSASSAPIQETARAIAVLDVLCSFARVAVSNRYVKPEVVEESVIKVSEGRHPVLERVLTERFIPNDTLVDTGRDQILIITGPNMAGKSTYIRQVALIVLMAQVGSFVPASSATIGIADRIFTRVGASDELTRGQSTFMVEMNETANILHNATGASLVVLDEIGRGTSTFDGVSIAWAVAEYIHNNKKAKARTLFATHYHELTELSLYLPRVKNYNVAILEKEDRIVFLRKILEGISDKSYGIYVAKLAGLPQEVIDRANDILENFEKGELTEEGMPRLAKPGRRKPRVDQNQPDLFQ